MSTMACAVFTMIAFLTTLSAVQAAKYRVDYNVYHNYESFKSDVLDLSHDPRNRNIVRLSTARERTHTGEEIYLLSLSNHRRSFAFRHLQGGKRSFERVNKTKVLFVFGEHARELIVVESFFALVRNLTEGYRQPCSTPQGHYSRFILDNVELHLIGLLNPDGKKKLEKTGNYCWRNNERGVDLNRNANWQFNGPGSSNQEGHEEYNGGKAFSEPEARFIRDLVQREQYDGYLTLHSGERRRPTTDRELELVSKVVKESNGWFRNSGIAYEMNRCALCVLVCLIVVFAVTQQMALCLIGWLVLQTYPEMWGGPVYPDCFVQFNPSPKSPAFENDLRAMSSVYTTMLLHLVEDFLGKKYEPLPPIDKKSARSTAKSKQKHSETTDDSDSDVDSESNGDDSQGDDNEQAPDNEWTLSQAQRQQLDEICALADELDAALVDPELFGRVSYSGEDDESSES